jgi:hypothetical protein
METNDIKNSLHTFIDGLDNDIQLKKIYDLMIKTTSDEEAELWNSLSDEQKSILLLADLESDNSENLISFQQQKEKHRKWL